jgi:hypothetical protein
MTNAARYAADNGAFNCTTGISLSFHAGLSKHRRPSKRWLHDLNDSLSLAAGGGI